MDHHKNFVKQPAPVQNGIANDSPPPSSPHIFFDGDVNFNSNALPKAKPKVNGRDWTEQLSETIFTVSRECLDRLAKLEVENQALRSRYQRLEAQITPLVKSINTYGQLSSQPPSAQHQQDKLENGRLDLLKMILLLTGQKHECVEVGALRNSPSEGQGQSSTGVDRGSSSTSEQQGQLKQLINALVHTNLTQNTIREDCRYLKDRVSTLEELNSRLCLMLRRSCQIPHNDRTSCSSSDLTSMGYHHHSCCAGTTSSQQLLASNTLSSRSTRSNEDLALQSPSTASSQVDEQEGRQRYASDCCLSVKGLDSRNRRRFSRRVNRAVQVRTRKTLKFSPMVSPIPGPSNLHLCCCYHSPNCLMLDKTVSSLLRARSSPSIPQCFNSNTTDQSVDCRNLPLANYQPLSPPTRSMLDTQSQPNIAPGGLFSDQSHPPQRWQWPPTIRLGHSTPVLPQLNDRSCRLSYPRYVNSVNSMQSEALKTPSDNQNGSSGSPQPLRQYKLALNTIQEVESNVQSSYDIVGGNSNHQRTLAKSQPSTSSVIQPTDSALSSGQSNTELSDCQRMQSVLLRDTKLRYLYRLHSLSGNSCSGLAKQAASRDLETLLFQQELITKWRMARKHLRQGVFSDTELLTGKFDITSTDDSAFDSGGDDEGEAESGEDDLDEFANPINLFDPNELKQELRQEGTPTNLKVVNGTSQRDNSTPTALAAEDENRAVKHQVSDTLHESTGLVDQERSTKRKPVSPSPAKLSNKDVTNCKQQLRSEPQLVTFETKKGPREADGSSSKMESPLETAVSKLSDPSSTVTRSNMPPPVVIHRRRFGLQEPRSGDPIRNNDETYDKQRPEARRSQQLSTSSSQLTKFKWTRAIAHRARHTSLTGDKKPNDTALTSIGDDVDESCASSPRTGTVTESTTPVTSSTTSDSISGSETSNDHNGATTGHPNNAARSPASCCPADKQQSYKTTMNKSTPIIMIEDRCLPRSIEQATKPSSVGKSVNAYAAENSSSTPTNNGNLISKHSHIRSVMNKKLFTDRWIGKHRSPSSGTTPVSKSPATITASEGKLDASLVTNVDNMIRNKQTVTQSNFPASRCAKSTPTSPHHYSKQSFIPRDSNRHFDKVRQQFDQSSLVKDTEKPGNNNWSTESTRKCLPNRQPNSLSPHATPTMPPPIPPRTSSRTHPNNSTTVSSNQASSARRSSQFAIGLARFEPTSYSGSQSPSSSNHYQAKMAKESTGQHRQARTFQTKVSSRRDVTLNSQTDPRYFDSGLYQPGQQLTPTSLNPKCAFTSRLASPLFNAPSYRPPKKQPASRGQESDTLPDPNQTGDYSDYGTMAPTSPPADPPIFSPPERPSDNSTVATYRYIYQMHSPNHFTQPPDSRGRIQR